MPQGTQTGLCGHLEVGGAGGWGRLQREGTYAYLRLTHVNVWKKPTKFCKAIILQLKINKKFLKGVIRATKARKGSCLWHVVIRRSAIK